MSPDTRRVISFGDQLLAPDARCLNIFNVSAAAPSVEPVELLGVRMAVPDTCELLSKVDRIVYTAVQSEAAQRIVDVRGISDKHDPPLAKTNRDALMRPINTCIADIKFPNAWDKAGHSMLNRDRIKNLEEPGWNAVHSGKLGEDPLPHTSLSPTPNFPPFRWGRICLSHSLKMGSLISRSVVFLAFTRA